MPNHHPHHQPHHDVNKETDQNQLAQSSQRVLQTVPSPTPTPEELANLSLAARRLWALDDNRLTPGPDGQFELNLQHNTFVSGTVDNAKEPLFKHVNEDLFMDRPTFAKFHALLSNYHCSDGIPETPAATQIKHEFEFIDTICDTQVMRYVHAYLQTKRLASSDLVQFKQALHALWFALYKRIVPNDTCAFKHAFAGEIRGDEVIGFHNWITFFIEEKAGRADYRGFILPRGKHHGSAPTGTEHVLSFQLAWRGDVKPVSSFLIGVSPEYELALYTLCFFAGEEGKNVCIEIDGVDCEIEIHRFWNHDGHRIGTAFVRV